MNVCTPNLFTLKLPVINHTRRHWVWLLLFLPGYEASAQKIWSLTECLSFAQTNNTQVQQASLIQDKSILQLKRAKNQFLPTVDARVRSAGNWGFLIDPSTNLLSNQFNYGNQGSLNFNLDLFNGFANANQVKLRDQELTTANFDRQISINNISLEITYSYLQVLLAHEQLKNSKLRSTYLDKQQQKVKAQVSKGVLSKRDLLNLQSLVAAEDLIAVNAEVSIEKSTFNLMQVMGLALNDVISVDTISIPDNWGSTDLTLNEVLDSSATALPDLKAAQSRVQAAYHLWQFERAGYMPTLSLTAQVATRTSNYKPETFGSQLKDNLNQQVGLTLYVPIFNRFMLRNTDQLAKLDLMASKLAYQQVDRDLRGKVMNAFVDYRAAAKKHKALQVQYDAISEEYRYAEKMLELGGIDAVEYSVTRSRLVTAQSELLQAKYDRFFKQKMLDFYQGKPLSF